MGNATYTVTVTNNSNGVSVDYETETPATLLVPDIAAVVQNDNLQEHGIGYKDIVYIAGDAIVQVSEEDPYALRRIFLAALS